MTTKYDLQFRSQITDQKRRNKYALKELDSIVLKSVLGKGPLQSQIDLDTRLVAEKKLQNLKQNSLTRVRNRCVISGRNSTVDVFRLSRICFREQAGRGNLMGISKRLNK